ncbi:MAG: hypothetical protein QCH96_02030 [Candidatus Thermoplasmatota archaeon]|nr:hypothetical protein [Candidatus Thermoplasmatota archaeon]
MDRFARILRNIPPYSRFLTVREIDTLTQEIRQMPGVTHHEIGSTIDGQPLTMLDIGKGDKTALIIGVPHSDEPLGSLVITYFARWLATHQDVDYFGWRWLLIPILERRGMQLNQGWFTMPNSLALMVKSSFREPTEDQYEWSFPIEYKDYQWTKSRPETIAVKKVLEKEKPDLLCGLHHSGFTNAYYYLSEDFPQIYEKLSRFVASLRIPLSDSAPDVPFGKQLHPGFYQMYGLKDYLTYYEKTDPLMLPALRRGACSDEWYQNEIGGFSFNCEVPMYLSHKLKDTSIAKKTYLDMITERYERKKTRVNYSDKFIRTIREYADMADPLLYPLAQKHIANAKASLGHEERILRLKKDRAVTNADIFESEVVDDLFDLFFLGQIWRVAESVCVKGGAKTICRQMELADLEIKLLAKSIQERGLFYQIPLRTLVKMQLGSILYIAEELMKNEEKQ